jgi:signal recognition particle GTPase
VTDDIVVGSRSDFDAALASMARTHRMVFFSGLPGVGKSLFIRELARVAHAMGRNVHVLQWDVVRPAFESRAILARYPERTARPTLSCAKPSVDGCARRSIRWHREHGSSSEILIGKCR